MKDSLFKNRFDAGSRKSALIFTLTRHWECSHDSLNSFSVVPSAFKQGLI